MAIKSNCYNDVRISGVSRQKKLFTSIDRHEGPKKDLQNAGIITRNKDQAKKVDQ